MFNQDENTEIEVEKCNISKMKYSLKFIQMFIQNIGMNVSESILKLFLFVNCKRFV